MLSISKGYLYTFLFAFCSLGYEFIFIKTSILIQGGQIDKYNLIVSLFTFSLGIGALAAEKVKAGREQDSLFKIEVSLFLSGLLGPVLTLYFQSSLICHIFIMLVGFLSGFELPLLFKMFNKNIKEILSLDYFGMFLAAIIVPLFLLKKIGLMPTLFILITINLFVAAKLKKSKVLNFIANFIFILFFIFSIVYHQKINSYFSDLYISGIL